MYIFMIPANDPDNILNECVLGATIIDFGEIQCKVNLCKIG